MRKTSDSRTWPMCSASGPMHHFLHRTRMSDVSVSGLSFTIFNFTNKFILSNITLTRSLEKITWTLFQSDNGQSLTRIYPVIKMPHTQFLLAKSNFLVWQNFVQSSVFINYTRPNVLCGQKNFCIDQKWIQLFQCIFRYFSFNAFSGISIYVCSN